ncbi:hypothetical protein B0H19DRAFT_1263740 [Mycena capillaripes]|nr:hypothetical protein B0H19DRAFT_1263740 [Mycena capillaripes]
MSFESQTKYYTYTPASMTAQLRDPDPAIVRDVIFYPADGGTPCITPRQFSAKEAARTCPASGDLDPCRLFGAQNMLATREKSCTWGQAPNQKAYTMYWNMSPELPVNLAIARVMGADPHNLGERLLWRGDALAVRNCGTLGMHYLNATGEDLGSFSSFIIPRWYNSKEWRDFLRNEERDYQLLRLRQAMLGNPLPDPSADATQIDDRNLSIYCEGMRRLLPQWKAIESEQLHTVRTSRTPKLLRDPYEATSHKSPEETTELDSYERYSLYYNLNPDLPVNRSMARLVGVNPKRAGTLPLWRGDVVVVKWREWLGKYPDYVDMSPEIMERFNSRLIPDWYSSDSWRNLLDRLEQFNENIFKPGSWWNPWNILSWVFEDNSRSADVYEKRVRIFQRLRAISATSPIPRRH